MSELRFDPSVFWARPFPMVLTGGEMRVLFTGAARYAMRRVTPASRMTADAVRAHLRDLDEGTLGVVARDVRWETEAWGAGSCPHFWSLPDEIDAELERRRHDR